MPSRAYGKPDAMVVQEREVSAQTSHSSEDHRASGKPATLFSPSVMSRETKLWSSVFSGTLLRGNKDHLLN